jgi:hypothetical protein
LLDSFDYIRATDFIELVTRQNIILEKQGDRRGFCLLVWVGLSAGFGWQGSRCVGLSGAAAWGQSRWAVLAGQQAAHASGAWQYGFLYSNTPLQTDGSFYHQFVQNSKIAGSEAVEAA